MAGSFALEPLDASFGARVTGVRLAQMDDEAFAALYDAWLQYALLIFPDQHLSNEEQVAFAKRIGPMEFDIMPLSNVRTDGSVRADDRSDNVVAILKGNMGWHHDSTYMAVQAKGAVFTAHVVPEQGGETGWADMRAAYDALSPDLKKRLDNYSAFHSLYYSQMQAGYDPKVKGDYSGYGLNGQEPPLRPLVKTHPETGRRSLLIGRHAYGIPGLSEEASKQLLDDLVQDACQAPRVYHHRWTAGDAVLWDNRCLMHRARPWDMKQPRVMYHSRIAGEQASEYADHHGK